MKSALLLPFLVIATGCDSSYTVPPRGDAGDGASDAGNSASDGTVIVSDDSGNRPLDASPPNDASPGADARVTLDGGPRQTLRYVISEVTLPTSASAYAFDHDGDGSTENQYGGIVALMAQSGASLQAVMNASLAAGEDLQLIALDTSDPALLADTAPVVRQHVAISSSGPDFSGSGSFAVNGSKPAAVYPGILFAAQYASTLPRMLATPPTVHLRLPIGDGRTALLPLVGARLEAHVTTTGLVEGRLHGAWRQSDVNTIVLPAIATQLNAIAQQVPCGNSCTTVKQFFDSNGDGTITATDLMQSPLVSATFAPDLDLYDNVGGWSPNPLRTSRDSLSVSVAFRAVRAQFTAP